MALDTLLVRPLQDDEAALMTLPSVQVVVELLLAGEASDDVWAARVVRRVLFFVLI